MTAVPPDYDPAPLRRLSESMGGEGPAVVRELLDIFAATAPQYLAELRAAIGSADAATIRRTAHTLKANASTLGATRLAEAARAVESRVIESDLDGAAAALPALDDAFAAVAVVLRDVVERSV